MKRDRANSAHYYWGDMCEGWILGPSPDMMIIEERMPPGTAERRHFHHRARQFFYVLEGELTMVLAGFSHRLQANTGIEIEPGMEHQARNDSDADVCFIVASSPSTREDRVDVG